MFLPNIKRTGQGQHEVTGYSMSPSRTIELFKHRKSISKKRDKIIIADTGVFGQDLIDISWLAGASQVYNISDDPKDYVLADVPIITVDFPNRNTQAFPFEEISYFDPMYGNFVYNSFIGKPTFINHDNKVPQKARGVHFMSSLQKVPNWNIWKIRVLTGWDRTKDAHTANKILKGKNVGFSMGAYVEVFLCSICGKLHTMVEPCNCIKMGRGSIVNGNLCYQLCVGVVFFETSEVGDPADVTAYGNILGQL